jgi:hypothetical protein
LKQEADEAAEEERLKAEVTDKAAKESKVDEEVERERRLKQETDTMAEKAAQNVFEELVAEIAADIAERYLAWAEDASHYAKVSAFLMENGYSIGDIGWNDGWSKQR